MHLIMNVTLDGTTT